jgi:uncharacterized oxidoreductase
MKTNKNTILITGGGSGIGFEFAKLFSEAGNQVIITGRNEDKLKDAASKLQNVSTIACDITNEEEVNRLARQISTDFPDLNILINNAGNASLYNILTPGINAFEKAHDEINTNFLSILRLTEKLLPVLNLKKEAAVVNVSSIVALVPSLALATYSASKAALHSYTQSLRIALEKETNTKVFEIMPPLVNTDFSKAIGGENGISPAQVASDLFNAMEEDRYEIHVGQTSAIYDLFHSSPADALVAMNS